MGLFDFFFGRKNEEQARPASPPPSFGEGPIRLGHEPAGYQSYPSSAQQPAAPHAAQSENEQALQRYRYMLRTAPPETIEQAHAEAFSKLTPEQRTYVLQALANELPAHERVSVNLNQNDPQTLARIATRAELRQPGTVERTLGAHHGHGGMMGGGMGAIAGTLMMSFAAGFVGSMVAAQFFDMMGDPLEAAEEALPVEELAMDDGFGEDFASYDGGMEEF